MPEHRARLRQSRGIVDNIKIFCRAIVYGFKDDTYQYFMTYVLSTFCKYILKLLCATIIKLNFKKRIIVFSVHSRVVGAQCGRKAGQQRFDSPEICQVRKVKKIVADTALLIY